MREPTLTVLNHYTLNGSPDNFVVAAQALAARVKSEGHPGVLSYRFFAGPESARAVVDYADAAAWIGHHEIAMGWPEMKALHQAAGLAHSVFLGSLTDEIRAWLAGSGLTVRVEEGYTFTAGFRRD
jgi:hypothetical protein